MYIDLTRTILVTAVETYARRHGKTVSEVLKVIRDHIDETAQEHRKEKPKIKYENSLCRLGYLYRHASANATLFEKVISESGELRSIIRSAKGKTLELCAVGGGPGTELLGLAKFLLHHMELMPRKVTFTVLDAVPEWNETWKMLAHAVEDELAKAESAGKCTCPAIANGFLPLDVLSVKSYENYSSQFDDVDVIVFNYLFSENKARLPDAGRVVKHLYAAAKCGCAFVVIDRLENSTGFQREVSQIFEAATGKTIEMHKLGGTMDKDEQLDDMGKMLSSVLGSPRVKFFTDMQRNPTVFWFVGRKD